MTEIQCFRFWIRWVEVFTGKTLLKLLIKINDLYTAPELSSKKSKKNYESNYVNCACFTKQIQRWEKYGGKDEKLIEITVSFLLYMWKKMMILKLATGEIYFNNYFYKICCLRRGGEQDQLVYIGQINFQKSAEFSESTIISNVFRKIGLLQNQLESDDFSARVLSNAHLRSDERSASNWKKKISCFYFQINEDIALQIKVFIKI